jgi:hypothetical protein
VILVCYWFLKYRKIVKKNLRKYYLVSTLHTPPLPDWLWKPKAVQSVVNSRLYSSFCPKRKKKKKHTLSHLVKRNKMLQSNNVVYEIHMTIEINNVVDLRGSDLKVSFFTIKQDRLVISFVVVLFSLPRGPINWAWGLHCEIAEFDRSEKKIEKRKDRVCSPALLRRVWSDCLSRRKISSRPQVHFVAWLERDEKVRKYVLGMCLKIQILLCF